jgi:hypothetical protein
MGKIMSQEYKVGQTVYRCQPGRYPLSKRLGICIPERVHQVDGGRVVTVLSGRKTPDLYGEFSGSFCAETGRRYGDQSKVFYSPVIPEGYELGVGYRDQVAA